MCKTNLIIFFSIILIGWSHFGTAGTSCEGSFLNETEAKKSGYTEPIFYNGLNAVNQITKLGKSIRVQVKDPKIDPVKNLEDSIETHLRHIERGLIETRQLEKLNELKILRKEALDRIQKQQTTLYWWQLFNIRLAALATQPFDGTFDDKDIEVFKALNTHDKLSNYIENSKNPHTIADDIRQTVNLFPKKVVLPTTSPLGILALNQVSKNGLQIIPVELFNKKTFIDGIFMDVLTAHTHDFIHIINADYGTPLFPKNPRLHRRIISRIEELPLEKRKKAEVIYWTLTHELLSEERPTINQAADTLELMKIINYPTNVYTSIVFNIFKQAKIINPLNDNNTEKDMTMLIERNNLLLEESVKIFTQTVREALQTES